MSIKNVCFSVVLCGVFFCSEMDGQQYSSTRVKPKYKSYKDSLKQVDYHYVFPILGQQAYRKGFDIPYPVGLMANYMWMQQSLIFDNFQLGFKNDNHDIPLTDVDFIEFGKNENTSYSVNFRPDIWVFPFLNVYGIFGFGSSTTKVNLNYPIELYSEVKQDITTKGFGIMTAFGVGPVWVSCDANWTWNKPELLDKAVNVNVLGVRMGHTIVFKKRKDRNFAIWVGGMRAKMGSTTVGEVRLGDALPPDVWNRQQEIVDNYQAWYDGLGNTPVDNKKREVADNVLTPVVEQIEAADGNAIIRYGMSKQVKEKWNGVVGIQFQLNKRWMFRSEGGIIGDRKSLLLSANYRFLL